MLNWHGEAIVGDKSEVASSLCGQYSNRSSRPRLGNSRGFLASSHHTSCYQPPVCYGRGAEVGRGRGVGAHLPVQGVGVGVGVGVGALTYSSALARSPLLLSPPATSTFPLGSNVAV